jgi:hypothetical protein
MSTTFSSSAFAELDKFKTPNFDAAGEWSYQDADEELQEIAKFIVSKSSHNSDIDPSRIKFLYTTKVKKDGGRFVLGSLAMRSDVERMVNEEYDYIAIIYYPVWKDLDSKNKVIQLDKILCGVDLAPGKDPAEIVVKKRQTDSREYLENMRFFGPEEVLKSSEIVDLAVQRIIEEEAEQKKLAKEQNKKKNKKEDD